MSEKPWAEKSSGSETCLGRAGPALSLFEHAFPGKDTCPGPCGREVQGQQPWTHSGRKVGERCRLVLPALKRAQELLGHFINMQSLTMVWAGLWFCISYQLQEVPVLLVCGPYLE